ncbi:L,D-transpeptidase family protein [Xanthomonas massiliensis]|uniref:L,D-transpeptidase family protein n=1 Tax=Xanthomonas massiliensis TaxID=1720302 RepID=UPI00098FDEA9|nr:L,D-transpeptidase family protein [Xanthomonas massiliensis]
MPSVAPAVSRPAARRTPAAGWRRPLAWLLAIAAVPALAGARDAAPDPLAQARQLVVVTAPDWNAPHGWLQAWQRDAAGRWQAHGAGFAVSLGRAGSAWGLGVLPPPEDAPGPHKREGDGRSPAGVFGIGTAFGYAATIDSAMPYQPMQADSYCMDVPASPYYNQLVRAAQVGSDAVAGSSEPMRLDLHHDGDLRYREGFVIEHNPQAVPGQGSCIFAHLRRAPGEPTAGCTAMEPANMQRLLAWLQPQARPLFVLLPLDAYRGLQAAWRLPALAEAGR